MATVALPDLFLAALQLPSAERSDLVMQLIASLDGSRDENADAAWADEISERVAGLRAGRAEVVSFKDALADAQAELRAIRG